MECGWGGGGGGASSVKRAGDGKGHEGFQLAGTAY